MNAPIRSCVRADCVVSASYLVAKGPIRTRCHSPRYLRDEAISFVSRYAALRQTVRVLDGLETGNLDLEIAFASRRSRLSRLIHPGGLGRPSPSAGPAFLSDLACAEQTARGEGHDRKTIGSRELDQRSIVARRLGWLRDSRPRSSLQPPTPSSVALHRSGSPERHVPDSSCSAGVPADALWPRTSSTTRRSWSGKALFRSGSS